MQLTKQSLTIKKGATKSDEYSELVFDNIEMLRELTDDDNFFAGIKIKQSSKGAVSQDYGVAYALVNRQERSIKPFDRATNTASWTVIPWSEISLSANRQSADTNPENVKDNDNTTAWSLDSYDGNPDSEPYSDAWYQFNFSSPKTLKGYTLRMYQGRLSKQLRNYSLQISKDGGKTLVTFKGRSIQTRTRSIGRDPQTRTLIWAFTNALQTTEFEEAPEGINAVRFLCDSEKGDGVFYLAGIQFFAE